MINLGEQLGLWIDIFPLDRCPKDKKKQVVYKKIAFYKWIINISNSRLGTGTTKWKAVLNFPIALLTRLIDSRKVAIHIDKVLQKYDVCKSPCVVTFLGAYGVREQMLVAF